MVLDRSLRLYFGPYRTRFQMCLHLPRRTLESKWFRTVQEGQGGSRRVWDGPANSGGSRIALEGSGVLIITRTSPNYILLMPAKGALLNGPWARGLRDGARGDGPPAQDQQVAHDQDYRDYCLS
jgi:hypothetical protein